MVADSFNEVTAAPPVGPAGSTAIAIEVAAPYDLARTLGPLRRGTGDPTMRMTTDAIDIALRRRDGPVALRLRQVHRAGGVRISGHAWGPGSADVAVWLPGLLGVAEGKHASGSLRDAPDRIVADLARRMPGIRIPATGAVLDALIPAILEQKVTGEEARRAWRRLVQALGEPASERAEGLRLSPHPEVLARTPYHRFHPFGVERRRAELIRHVASKATWLEDLVDVSPTEAQAQMRRIPGIGPWTAAEVAVRALGDEDAVSVGDFHLPNIAAWALAREPRADDARMLELLEPYAGRRALVIRLLESSGLRVPRYGPRLSPRRIEDH